MTNEEFIESIRLEGEEWRTIPDWERYMVSSYGRIVSKQSPYKHQEKTYVKRNALLKPSDNGHGYKTIILSDGNGIQKRLSIHRLVAFAFIPNPNNYPQINHKDENVSNNKAENLEWCTQKYNNNYGTCKERRAKTIRNTHPFRRRIVQLSKNDVFIACFESISLASDFIKIPKTTIDNALIHGNLVRNKYKFLYIEDYESLVKQNVKELLPNG